MSLFDYRQDVAAATVLQERHPRGVVGRLFVEHANPYGFWWRVCRDDEHMVVLHRRDLPTDTRTIRKYDLLVHWRPVT